MPKSTFPAAAEGLPDESSFAVAVQLNKSTDELLRIIQTNGAMTREYRSSLIADLNAIAAMATSVRERLIAAGGEHVQ